MRAAYVSVPFRTEIRDIPEPVIGPNEVLVKVGACGVCGTDLHNARDFAKTTPEPLGHECWGTVEKLGPGVTGAKIGDRVIVENHTALARSAQAKNGNLVDSTDLYITMDRQACMAERVRTHVMALHDAGGLDSSAAAIAEPLTVALDLVESSDIGLGSTVAIFGAGPIGLMVLALVKAKGVSKAVITQPSHSTARIALARKLGADRVIMPDREDVVAALKAECPSGFDRVLVTAPPAAIPLAFEVVRFGAIVTFNGISFASSTISFDANAFHFKRLQLRATHSIPNLRFPMAISLLERRVIDARDFVTHTFPLSRVQEALTVAEEDKTHVIKVVVEID
ncbi:MAG TPA: alcohol dehydrogenase catalytic domain-containing protein [Spirochaetia bacterium]